MILPPPRGLHEIIAAFGDLDDPRFEAENIVQFALPYPLRYDGKVVLKSRCHRRVVEVFQGVLEAISMAGLQHECASYGGIYASRPQRAHPRFPSTHSWGIAIDLEPERYPLGSQKRFPPAVVDIFTSAGFTYGGDFRIRKDPMHFQYCSGY